MKPKTDVQVVVPYIEDVDMVLIMTVEPGFGGQKFMDDMMPKVSGDDDGYFGLDICVNVEINFTGIYAL